MTNHDSDGSPSTGCASRLAINRISDGCEPNALASGLAAGFSSSVAKQSDILLRLDASADGSQVASRCKKDVHLTTKQICPVGRGFLVDSQPADS